MRVRWKAVAGASGYMILYAPLTEEDASDEKEVRTVLVCNESKCEAKNELMQSRVLSAGHQLLFQKTMFPQISLHHTTFLTGLL